MEFLSGRIAAITGGASGIGAATASVFACCGAAGIVLIDLNREKSLQITSRISELYGIKVIAVKADVSSEGDAAAAFETIVQEFGTIDILVNSAGICRIQPMDEITAEQWDRTMDINLKGTFLFSREALKIMKKNKSGKIVNVASQAGKIGGLIVSPDYPASKAGVLCLTKSLAKIAAPFNINVNSVAPGLINTEMTAEFGYDASSVPLGRIGTPEEVADVIVFLASDMSRYITGACIDVNGGMTMW